MVKLLATIQPVNGHIISQTMRERGFPISPEMRCSTEMASICSRISQCTWTGTMRLSLRIYRRRDRLATSNHRFLTYFAFPCSIPRWQAWSQFIRGSKTAHTAILAMKSLFMQIDLHMRSKMGDRFELIIHRISVGCRLRTWVGPMTRAADPGIWQLERTYTRSIWPFLKV